MILEDTPLQRYWSSSRKLMSTMTATSIRRNWSEFRWGFSRKTLTWAQLQRTTLQSTTTTPITTKDQSPPTLCSRTDPILNFDWKNEIFISIFWHSEYIALPIIAYSKNYQNIKNLNKPYRDSFVLWIFSSFFDFLAISKYS